MTISRADQLEGLLNIPVPLLVEDLEEAISLCDSEEQLKDPRLIEDLSIQNKADKEMLRRLWAERRHLVTEGVG